MKTNEKVIYNNEWHSIWPDEKGTLSGGAGESVRISYNPQYKRVIICILFNTMIYISQVWIIKEEEEEAPWKI